MGVGRSGVGGGMPGKMLGNGVCQCWGVNPTGIVIELLPGVVVPNEGGGVGRGAGVGVCGVVSGG